jgi:thioredoxin-related protein
MTNYENAIKKGIDTYKPVMMVIKSTSCPWCKKLENQVLQKKHINELIQTGFVPLVLNKDIDKYPKKRFDAKGVPTTFFINPLTYEAFHLVKGYKNHKEFLKELNKAKKIYYKGDKI